MNTVTLPEACENFLKIYHDDSLKNFKEGSDLLVNYHELDNHLKSYEYEHYLSKNPKKLTETLENIWRRLTKTDTSRIAIDEMPYNYYLRQLDSNHIGKMISCTAMVKSVSQIMPRIQVAVFRCKGCLREYKVVKKSSALSEPSMCQDCSSRSFHILTEETTFTNSQIMILQEPLELRKDGTIRDFPALAEGELVDPDKKISPGDLVHVTSFMNVHKKKKSKTLSFCLTVNNIKQLKKTYEDIQITDDDIKWIHELANKENVVEKLTNLIAPEIQGLNDIKEAILLQLFSGNTNHTVDSRRLDIHILMVGDPGLAKSELLKSVQHLSPKGIYVNGATATQAGLLATAVKDERSGRWSIEAGAMPMADQGLLCLDELDKMSWEDLSSLNEPMEQQTVTETKAGLNVTMSARTPLLAACNPKGGKLYRSDSFEDSVKMIPEATLSRFDLIYFLEDVENYDKDVELAKMLLHPKQSDLHSDLSERICKYIAYSKREFSPEITTGAEELLTHYFGKIRQAKLGIDDGKPITPRDFMALKRLSISIARIRLSNHVDIDDALYAINVFEKSLKTHGSYVNVEFDPSQLELPKECMST